ncbi:MAG: hypothetical protein E7527_06665 [Ruminococcaceae bacterium]|nr:hypothetical protein [Oscillospiraceae bacterium]
MNRRVMSLYSRFKGTKLGTWMRHRRWNKQLLSVDGINRIIDAHVGDTLSAEQKAALLQDILRTAKKYRSARRSTSAIILRTNPTKSAPPLSPT